MTRLKYLLITSGLLFVGCADTDTRTRTVTPEEKREAGADAMNSGDTGQDADLVGTDEENSPRTKDVPDKKDEKVEVR